MAKVIIDGKEFTVADGERFIGQAEEAGVPFGCTEGICGTCKLEVLEGGENLTPKNQEEIDFGLNDNERLGCQCRIKSGTVKFKFE